MATAKLVSMTKLYVDDDDVFDWLIASGDVRSGWAIVLLLAVAAVLGYAAWHDARECDQHECPIEHQYPMIVNNECVCVSRPSTRDSGSTSAVPLPTATTSENYQR